MDVIKVFESESQWGEKHWLLELGDGRAVLVFWSGQTLLGKLADTSIPSLWSYYFNAGGQDGQVMARYLPDEKTHDWATTKAQLREKFNFREGCDEFRIF
jgi:hypothetical protein